MEKLNNIILNLNVKIIDKICDKSSEKGKDVCMKYPCCVWAKFKDKK